MDLQSHKRTLGIIHIVYGSLTAIIFIFIGSFISLLFPFLTEEIANDVGKDADEIMPLATLSSKPSLFYF